MLGLIQPGEIYRHYKGGLYQVVAKATHTETNEELVIYQALYGEFKVFARPLAMFCDNVEGENGSVIARFEKTRVLPDYKRQEEDEAAASEEKVTEPVAAAVAAEEEIIEGVNPALFKFLDSNTIEEKLEILHDMRKSMDDKTITDIAVSMDLVIEEGPLEERIKNLEYCLKTRAKYETTRLR